MLCQVFAHRYSYVMILGTMKCYSGIEQIVRRAFRHTCELSFTSFVLVAAFVSLMDEISY